jgi:NAD(P)-dependent dehydrogenase (short-subunit alcohol dehydrogenase family)
MSSARQPTALVTGGTSGIGRALAQLLATAGANVGIVGRDATRGAAALTGIGTSARNPDVRLFVADLSSIAGIRALAEEVERTYPGLDLLINCAAIFTSRRVVSADGYELMLATNHLAPFLLTSLLLHPLAAAPAARVLTLTAPSTVCPDLNDLQSERQFSALRAFGATKAANLLFTFTLARRLELESSPISVNAVHPGVARSTLMRDASAPVRWASWILSRSPERAAEGILPLAVSDAYAGVSGRFFHRGREIRPAPFTRDIDLQDRLWEASAALVGLPLPRSVSA